MDSFYDGFIELIEAEEGNRVSQFFKKAADAFEEPEEQDFILWFREECKGSVYVSSEHIIPLFEYYYPLWKENQQLNSNLYDNS